MRVMLLLDARIETKTADRAAMELLDAAAVAFQIVLTKADDVAPGKLAARFAEAEALARAHTAAHPLVIVTSSATGQGIPELRAEIASLAK
jgi:GTP-binding protein